MIIRGVPGNLLYHN